MWAGESVYVAFIEIKNPHPKVVSLTNCSVLRKVLGPTMQVELVLEVGAVGSLLVQTSSEGKTGKHQPQCLWEGRTSIPVSAASVALTRTRRFLVGRPWEGALGALWQLPAGPRSPVSLPPWAGVSGQGLISPALLL